MKSILLIGDSIRMGYQDAVREHVAAWADAWGPQQTGGNSENVLGHLDEWLQPRQPDVVHVNCGLHDIKKEFDQETAAVPLDTYRTNVRLILQRLISQTSATVVFALTTPVNQQWHHENKQFDRFDADVLAYNQAASAICGELGISVNDLFSVVDSAGRNSVLLPDGVHFTPEGYALLGRSVADFVKRVGSNE